MIGRVREDAVAATGSALIGGTIVAEAGRQSWTGGNGAVVADAGRDWHTGGGELAVVSMGGRTGGDCATRLMAGFDRKWGKDRFRKAAGMGGNDDGMSRANSVGGRATARNMGID